MSPTPGLPYRKAWLYIYCHLLINKERFVSYRSILEAALTFEQRKLAPGTAAVEFLPSCRECKEIYFSHKKRWRAVDS